MPAGEVIESFDTQKYWFLAMLVPFSTHTFEGCYHRMIVSLERGRADSSADSLL
jgi:hypothetical protein